MAPLPHDLAALWAWRAAVALARRAPPACSYAVARRAMDAVHLGWSAGRRRASANLRHTLATDDPRVLHRASRAQFRRYGELLVDELQLQHLDPQTCFDALVTDEWPRMDAALRDDRPLIFALMHFGSWDVAGAALAARLRQVAPHRRFHVLVDQVGPPSLDNALQANRRRLGMWPISVDRSPLHASLHAMRALRGGAALGVLIDRPLPPDRPGVDVRLFDTPCRLPDGMARLALASGARVIPLALERLPLEREAGSAFRFRPHADFDFDYQPLGRRDLDVQRLTQQVLDVHERWIARAPDQWYQFRDFFLTPPPLAGRATPRWRRRTTVRRGRRLMRPETDNLPG